MDKAYTLIVALAAGIPNGIIYMLYILQLSGQLRRLPKSSLLQKILLPGILIGLSFHLTRTYIYSYVEFVTVMIVLIFVLALYASYPAFRKSGRTIVFAVAVAVLYLAIEAIGNLGLLTIIGTCPSPMARIDDNLERISALWFFDNIPKITLFLPIFYHNISIRKWVNKIEEK